MGTAKVIFAVLAVLVLSGGLLIYVYRAPVAVETAYEPQGDPPIFVSPVVDGMRLYRSPLLRFELRYPGDVQIREYSAGNTSTITFEDQKGEKGFQVFVVPYEGATISEERFKMDIPSEVIKEPTAIVIDGAPATMFFSSNAMFGETREVWFIHNGFLYEVTTYKDLDPWLSAIMTTWKFIY